MSDLTPRLPHRPLFWPDEILDIQEALADVQAPLYIVGGAVRDAYLHRPVKDLDLATPDNAIPLGRQIANRLKGEFFILDDERDVARVLVDTPQGPLVLDVARFRGADLLADLSDRDVRLNAMAVDFHSDLTHLIDPMGGEQDLNDHILRRCSPRSIPDDAIRALRIIRQSVQLDARIEAQTLRDIRGAASALADISPERIRDELFKMLASPRPAQVLRVADVLGLLRVVLPEVDELRAFQEAGPSGMNGWQHALMVVEKLHGIIGTINPGRTEYTAARFEFGMIVVALDLYRTKLQAHLTTLWPNERSHLALLMLAATLHEVGNQHDTAQSEHSRVSLIAERASALRLSNDEKQRLVLIIQGLHYLVGIKEVDDRSMHRFWRSFGDAGVDTCLLALADYLGTAGVYIDQDVWVKLVERVQMLLYTYFERYDEVVSPPPLVDGHDLMQTFKLKAGPVVGNLLEFIREGQAAGEICTVDDALEAARQYLKQQ